MKNWVEKLFKPAIKNSLISAESCASPLGIDQIGEYSILAQDLIGYLQP